MDKNEVFKKILVNVALFLFSVYQKSESRKLSNSIQPIVIIIDNSLCRVHTPGYHCCHFVIDGDVFFFFFIHNLLRL